MSMTAAQKRAKELNALKAELANVKDSTELSAEEIESKSAELEAKIADLEPKVAEDIAKAEAALAAQENTESASDSQRQGLARKKVNLDEDMERVHPTFATGVQAVMRDLIMNKGKK